MLESTLTSLLLSIAGRYAHLTPSDVGVGLSGGRLVLDNVRLRADALNQALTALPCDIVAGRAGRLRVNVPWTALSDTCVTVYLENVHLVAGARGGDGRGDGPPQTAPAGAGAALDGTADRWHETLLGRLGFNVAVELYGLKLEYRDRACVGIVSLASCKAYSADREWAPAFAPLDGAETGAVAMRKIFRLKGLHCVMLPRAGGNGDGGDGAGGSWSRRPTLIRHGVMGTAVARGARRGALETVGRWLRRRDGGTRFRGSGAAASRAAREGVARATVPTAKSTVQDVARSRMAPTLARRPSTRARRPASSMGPLFCRRCPRRATGRRRLRRRRCGVRAVSFRTETTPRTERRVKKRRSC
jgi:hypothetical protein